MRKSLIWKLTRTTDRLFSKFENSNQFLVRSCTCWLRSGIRFSDDRSRHFVLNEISRKKHWFWSSWKRSFDLICSARLVSDFHHL